ncbi:MAG: hypothetical protein ACOVQN_05685 [Exiguobacterium sp.]
MPLINEEERIRRFRKKYDHIDLHTSYVSLSQSSPEHIDDHSARVINNSVLNIKEYNQFFEAHFIVSLNGSFLSQIQQVYLNVEYQSFNGNVTYDQIEQHLILSREELASPTVSKGYWNLSGSIPQLIAPSRGYFTTSLTFEVNDPELDEEHPTLIGYKLSRIPVQVT